MTCCDSTSSILYGSTLNSLENKSLLCLISLTAIPMCSILRISCFHLFLKIKKGLQKNCKPLNFFQLTNNYLAKESLISVNNAWSGVGSGSGAAPINLILAFPSINNTNPTINKLIIAFTHFPQRIAFSAT